jgi:hypothetical protein
MTATATTRTATAPPINRGFAELRISLAILGIVAMSILLGVALAVSVIGAAERSGLELPAPGPMPQPVTAPVTDPAPPTAPQPIDAPPGLDL